VNITVNGKLRQMSPPGTLVDLLDTLKFVEKHYAVEVNGDVVPRDRHAEFLLSDGDQLEIVSLVGGG